MARGGQAPGRGDAAAHARRREAPVADDQAARRGRRRTPQPAEHAARVGQVRQDARGAMSLEDLGAVKAPAPQKAGAMKAVLTDERFSDPDWIYERKLDGIRCVAIRSGTKVRML